MLRGVLLDFEPLFDRIHRMPNNTADAPLAKWEGDHGISASELRANDIDWQSHDVL